MLTDFSPTRRITNLCPAGYTLPECLGTGMRLCKSGKVHRTVLGSI